MTRQKFIATVMRTERYEIAISELALTGLAENQLDDFPALTNRALAERISDALARGEVVAYDPDLVTIKHYNSKTQSFIDGVS